MVIGFWLIIHDAMNQVQLFEESKWMGEMELESTPCPYETKLY